MQEILFVNACTRPQSRTLRLARHVLAGLEGQIQEVELYREKVMPLSPEEVEQRQQLVDTRELEHPLLSYARQFAQTDGVVIAAPYWDLAFSAVLRAYLERVLVAGVTFRYDRQGVPQSLCRARRLIYVTTSGGPIGGLNLGYGYVKALGETFFHIPQIQCLQAEGLDVWGTDVEAILGQAMDRWDTGMDTTL